MMNSPLSPQEAANELLKRRRCRASAVEFAAHIDVPGRPMSDEETCENFKPVESNLASHHRLILEAMERTSKKHRGRLMIFMPPGSAKSTYASVVFPAFYLGSDGGRKIILASYGDILSRKMGRRTRSIVKQPFYGALFGAVLSSESSAAHEFSISNGSEYMAGGILSGITGNRANGLIIDDPIKGRDSAGSEAISQTTWEAYNDDLKSRLVPGGWTVLIMTRWSQTDIAGRILPSNWKGDSGVFRGTDGVDWEVLCIQARCETSTDPLGRSYGEYLWPEWFDAGHWSEFEVNQQTWASLFQQIPSPVEGGLFKPEKIHIANEIPEGSISWIRGWDFAATQNGGDYTVGAKLGRLHSGQFIISDVVRGRWETNRRDNILISTAEADGNEVTQSLPQDPGQAGKSHVLYMTRNLAGFKVISGPETGSKIVRADAFASQINSGNVIMIRGNWNHPLLEELRMFPNGIHDDQVDALSRAFNDLMKKKKSMWEL